MYTQLIRFLSIHNQKLPYIIIYTQLNGSNSAFVYTLEVLIHIYKNTFMYICITESVLSSLVPVILLQYVRQKSKSCKIFKINTYLMYSNIVHVHTIDKISVNT
ncbi:hypothetical protein ACF0H5_001269 [Mactra antiquata]